MVSIDHSVLELEKRVPLTIARGTRTHSSAVWLRWKEAGIEGWGEAVPVNVGNYDETIEDIVGALSERKRWLSEASAPSALIAGINQAVLDWLGKNTGRPAWQVLGLSSPGPGPITSVTVGISSPEAARVRVRQWREVGDVRAFKIKLGSPAGILADQRMFEAVQAEVGAGIRLSVDANGGWSVDDACRMAAWRSAASITSNSPCPAGASRIYRRSGRRVHCR
jgi:L-alanine-DL-glutamate epimerase-like enolase superfamily enzyme